MKILMLNYEFPPMGGGAGNATDNISKNLALAGHDVTVLTSRYGEQPPFEVKNGVKIYRVFSWRNSIHDCGFKGAYTYILFAAVKLMRLNRTERFNILHFFFSLSTGLLSLPYFPNIIRHRYCLLIYKRLTLLNPRKPVFKSSSYVNELVFLRSN